MQFVLSVLALILLSFAGAVIGDDRISGSPEVDRALEPLAEMGGINQQTADRAKVEALKVVPYAEWVPVLFERYKVREKQIQECFKNGMTYRPGVLEKCVEDKRIRSGQAMYHAMQRFADDPEFIAVLLELLLVERSSLFQIWLYRDLTSKPLGQISVERALGILSDRTSSEYAKRFAAREILYSKTPGAYDQVVTAATKAPGISGLILLAEVMNYSTDRRLGVDPRVIREFFGKFSQIDFSELLITYRANIIEGGGNPDFTDTIMSSGSPVAFLIELVFPQLELYLGEKFIARPTRGLVDLEATERNISVWWVQNKATIESRYEFKGEPKSLADRAEVSSVPNRATDLIAKIENSSLPQQERFRAKNDLQQIPYDEVVPELIPLLVNLPTIERSYVSAGCEPGDFKTECWAPAVFLELFSTNSSKEKGTYLLKLFDEPSGKRFRGMILTALKHNWDDAAVNTLLIIATDNREDIWTRRNAVEILALHARSESLAKLITLVRESNQNERENFISAMIPIPPSTGSLEDSFLELAFEHIRSGADASKCSSNLIGQIQRYMGGIDGFPLPSPNQRSGSGGAFERVQQRSCQEIFEWWDRRQSPDSSISPRE